MLDVNEAHKLLGVSKGASKNDIERRYSIILKKHRMQAADGQNEEEQMDIDPITSAYNLLMGYEEPPTEEELKAPNPVMQKMGIDEKKARNFFYYYKFHMLIGIIAILVVAFSIKGCVTKVEPDFNLAFIGNLGFTDTDKLKSIIKAQIPEIKEPGFDGAFIAASKNADGQADSGGQSGDQQAAGTQTNGQQMIQTDAQQEYAMQMKAMLLFAAAEIDLFILDKANYEKYAAQGAFISFDEIAPSLGVGAEKSKPYVVKNAEDNTEHIYGIDVSNSEVLKEAGILGDEMIVAIPVRAKQQEKANKVLRLLLK